MANSVCVRLLDGHPLAADDVMLDEKVLDLAHVKQLNAAVRVINKGNTTNGNEVWLQHSASKDEESYYTLEAIKVGTDATTGVQVFTFDNFLRFVRWKCAPGVSGSPRAFIDVVAKP